MENEKRKEKENITHPTTHLKTSRVGLMKGGRQELLLHVHECKRYTTHDPSLREVCATKQELLMGWDR